MNKLHVLGTGNGGALNCYNTCFALEFNKEYFLIDGGGGNQILKRLIEADINISKIHNIFVSHNHIDHIIGIVWLIRKVAVTMRMSDKYEETLNIYASDETIKGLDKICDVLLSIPQKRYIGDRIIFHEVTDMEKVEILNKEITFLDIKARKDKQFGFKLKIEENRYLTFLGDEPCNEDIYSVAKNSEWLLHEAFCLEEEKDKYNPHEKGHCTVKEASSMAEELKAKNLILWHTEDNNLKDRKELYTNEAKCYFNGNIFVPDDLEVIEL